MRAAPVFADTSYFVALVNPADEAHARAVQQAELHPLVITTEAILVELGNGLAAMRWRWLAVRLINMLRSNPNVKVVPVTTELLNTALDLFASHADKEWGVTDCISFVVMRQLKRTRVLTLNHHFTQAGFELIL